MENEMQCLVRTCVVYASYRDIILSDSLHHSSTQIVLQGARHCGAC